MNRFFRFHPKLLDCRSDYTFKTFTADLSAGVTVGIIALPMAMAFAIGSNVPPEAGLITAVVAGFLTSLFGGSRVAIGGPTGAFVAVVAGIVAQYGLFGLFACSILAGIILLLMGVARMGGLIRFIPSPLVKGFTTGIAVIILCGQLKDLLGIRADLGDTSSLIGTVAALFPHLGDIHPVSVAFGLLSVCIIYFWPKRFASYLPGSIAVLPAMTVAAVLLASQWGVGMETIGSKFGDIPRTLPLPELPLISFAAFQDLLAPALTVALLGAIESLLCATAADGMTDDNHDPDQELMAQGIANIVAPLFGGIPATGAIARTAANIRSGAKTPVAGMIHAFVLLLIMFLAAPLAKFIPLSVLSAVLVVVALNMGGWKEFIQLPRYPRSDIAVFLVTFLLTVVFGLTQAVTIGLFISCLFFIRHMSTQSRVGIRPLHHEHALKQQEEEAGAPQTHDDILLVTVTGAMFFGAAQKLKTILTYLKHRHNVLILRMSQVITLDATALITLEDIITRYRDKDVVVILSGLKNQPRQALKRAGVLRLIPKENIIYDIDEAVARAHALLDEMDAKVSTAKGVFEQAAEPKNVEADPAAHEDAVRSGEEKTDETPPERP